MSVSDSETPAYGAAPAEPKKTARKTRVHHLQQMKADGERWAMLTAYDYSSARLFEEAGIPVLLVGDSAANVVYGYDTTVPITVDELIPSFAASCAARRTPSSSPTCRSGPTRVPRSRPSRPRPDS